MPKKIISNRLLYLVTEKERKTGKLIREAQLARDLKLSRPTVHSWLENDVTKFEAPILLRMCEYFGCDLSDLLHIETVEDEGAESAQE